MNPADHAEAIARFAAASGTSANDVLSVVAAITAVFCLLWVAWIVLQLFDRWRSGRLEYAEFMWYALRACMVLMIVGYHVR